MSGIASRLWPETVTQPYLRLAAALIAAPLIATAVVAALAFLIAGMSEPTRVGVIAVTEDAAIAYFSFAAIFMVVAVLPALALLWWLGARRTILWLGAGLVFGAVGGVGLAALGGPEIAISAVMGTTSGGALLLLVRGIAGIRAG